MKLKQCFLILALAAVPCTGQQLTPGDNITIVGNVIDVNTATVPTRLLAQSGDDLTCASGAESGETHACAMQPTLPSYLIEPAPVTSIEIKANVATATASQHDLIAGNRIQLSGAEPASLNGVHRVDYIPTATTFMFATSGVADSIVSTSGMKVGKIGRVIRFLPGADCAGAPTLDVDTLGPKRLYEAAGTASMTCAAGTMFEIWYDGAADGNVGGWRKLSGSSGGAPAAGVSTMSSFLTAPVSVIASNVPFSAKAGEITCLKIYVPASLSVKTVSLNVASANAAGCVVGLGLYSSAGALLSAGSVSCTSTGPKSTAVNYELTAGEYYVGYASTEAKAAFTTAGNNSGPQGVGNAGSLAVIGRAVNVFDGAKMPATLGGCIAPAYGTSIPVAVIGLHN
jgi:hypothetical protein